LFSDSPIDVIEKQFSIVSPSPLQKVEADWTAFAARDEQSESKETEALEASHQVELWCKRDDLLHPIISGNKWRKLVKPLQAFRGNPPSHILSFGGPYSNHLHALSFCCQHLNIKFTAIIRGAYLKDQALNSTLQDLSNWNTNLVFVDKKTYQRRDQLAYLEELRKTHRVDVIIPEGGSQQDALFGMRMMLDEINAQNNGKPFDAIFLPVGSGASMAGVVEYCQPEIAKKIIGIAALKGEAYLESLVSRFLTFNSLPQDQSTQNKDTPYLPWSINHDFHFGAYAKTNAELNSFCKRFNQEQNKLKPSSLNAINNTSSKYDTPICIEPVYSGKCFYAIKSLIQQGHFAPNSKILIVHTGGLQGLRNRRLGE
jgi:1-aminocyclopropane-1-carboxylate deaminase